MSRRVQGQQGSAPRREREEGRLHRGLPRAAAGHADAHQRRGRCAGAGTFSGSGSCARTHATPSPSAAPAQPPATPRPSIAAVPGESACGNGYAHLPAAHTAVQFCTDAEAKGRCPGAAVVWVNTKSKVYHRAGANTYEHTKEGAYMCESDATAEGDRLSRNGH